MNERTLARAYTDTTERVQKLQYFGSFSFSSPLLILKHCFHMCASIAHGIFLVAALQHFMRYQSVKHTMFYFTCYVCAASFFFFLYSVWR